jgi:hypothetical protein
MCGWRNTVGDIALDEAIELSHLLMKPNAVK